MADAAETSQQTDERANGASRTNGGRKTAVRAAALAAATGATAFAAKKAFSGRDRSGSDEKPRRRRLPRTGDESTAGAMLASGWEAAKDSLLPFAEDAADSAGEWVANNGPEVVTETLMPRFIRGFEKARRKSAGDAE